MPRYAAVVLLAAVAVPAAAADISFDGCRGEG
jgi:hypothetical protein